jgi:hypothetical protein
MKILVAILLVVLPVFLYIGWEITGFLSFIPAHLYLGMLLLSAPLAAIGFVYLLVAGVRLAWKG